MTEEARLEGYRECHLCTVSEKMKARQCSFCTGRLDLAERLLLEGEKRRRGRIAPVLSAVMPGLGHWFSGRRYIGTYFFAMAPLSIGLILVTYQRWNWGLTTLTLTFLLVWYLAILDAKRGSREFRPPCQVACPAGISCSQYVHLTAKGMDLEALELVEMLCPFPGTIGRICSHPCEQECNRGKDGETVAICALKRYIDDYAQRPDDLYIKELEKIKKPLGRRVAVVGAGPAGLTAALYLRLLGFEVSLFEAENFCGGTPAIYMPAFRLPEDIYQREVERILDLGIDLRLGVRLGEDLTLEDIQKQGFSAVYLATGAMRSIKLPHTGEKNEGFLDGKEFLARMRSGERTRFDGEVLVIGGGNVAMDVARSAVRCGAAKVRVVCLEKKPEPGERAFRFERNEWREIKRKDASVLYMPAFPWEIREALKEGVEIVDGYATETFDLVDGRVTAVNCLEVEEIRQDKFGKIVPVLKDGSLLKLKADWVITAVGSSPDLSFLAEVPKRIPVLKGVPLLHLGSGADLTIPIILGGDAAAGPATVIEAVAAGKEAALYLYRVLMGNVPVSIRYRSRRTLEPWANYSDSPDFRRRRMEMVLSEGERKTTSKEVFRGFVERAAREEADRCMRCDWPLVRESKVRKFFRTVGK